MEKGDGLPLSEAFLGPTQCRVLVYEILHASMVSINAVDIISIIVAQVQAINISSGKLVRQPGVVD